MARGRRVRKGLNEDLIQTINSSSLDTWRSMLSSILSSFSLDNLQICLHDVKSISPLQLQQCFSLIEDNVKHLYQQSSWGWDPISKQAELREPATKYLIVQDPFEQTVLAFMSWQVDIEEDDVVVYCYELQLHHRLQRQGIGQKFLHVLEQVGIKLALSKVMLTVFTSNEPAFRFYTKFGYVVDPSSPKPRNFRSGRVIQPDYLILSKRLI